MLDLDIGTWLRPCSGHLRGGDLIWFDHGEAATVVVVVDVLGHGEQAHLVAAAIRSHLDENEPGGPEALLQGLDRLLHRGRGCAAGVAVIDHAAARLTYAGVGNTVLIRVARDGRREHLVSRSGVVGDGLRTVHLQQLHLADGDLVLLFTDGISDRLVSDMPRGWATHPANEISRSVVERCGRLHDDAACIALRVREQDPRVAS